MKLDDFLLAPEDFRIQYCTSKMHPDGDESAKGDDIAEEHRKVSDLKAAFKKWKVRRK